MSLCKRMIAGTSNSGLGLTAFLPTIYLQLSCTPSPIPWFQLWSCLRKLTYEQLLILQSGVIIDLTVSDKFCRSTALIYCLFLPSFLFPCMILSINDEVTCGLPNQWTRSIYPFRLWESRFSNSTCSWSISPRVHDLTTCGLLKSMVTIPLGVHGSKISTFQPFNLPLFFPGDDNPLTHVPFGSMVMIPLGIQGLEISTFQPFKLHFLFLGDENPLTHVPFVDTKRGVNQYQVQFKTFFKLYLNHSTISNEQ
jgi:hypothetical protein